MNIKYKFKNGDISLIIVVLVSGIILSFLIPLSQKLSVESNISKENLMSQQAIQAAKVGLEEWKYNLNRDDGITINIFNNPLTGTENWPNIQTSSIPNPPTVDGDWIVMDNTAGNRILYKVEYSPPVGTTLAGIIATGRVERGNLTIDRTLEESFE